MAVAMGTAERKERQSTCGYEPGACRGEEELGLAGESFVAQK